ncbi:MAG: hypothetical protein AAF673_05490 [Pseudomonadota bacterium]
MNYDDYSYQTPEELWKSMQEPGTCPEFAEEAAKIITLYARRYKPIAVPDTLTELRIRDLLSYEDMTKRKLKPEARDYWIKVYMLIIDRDIEYEETLLELSQQLIQ